MRKINLPESEHVSADDVSSPPLAPEVQRHLSDYEKRQIEKSEQLLKIVNKDSSGGKTETLNQEMLGVQEPEPPVTTEFSSKPSEDELQLFADCFLE